FTLLEPREPQLRLDRSRLRSRRERNLAFGPAARGELETRWPVLRIDRERSCERFAPVAGLRPATHRSDPRPHLWLVVVETPRLFVRVQRHVPLTLFFRGCAAKERGISVRVDESTRKRLSTDDSRHDRRATTCRKEQRRGQQGEESTRHAGLHFTSASRS